MALVGLHDVTLALGGPLLLDHVTLLIQPGDRVALVGRNGAGKSTLLRVLEGVQPPDSGEVVRRQGAVIARLPQEIPAELSGAAFDLVADGLGEPGRLLARYHDTAARLAREGGDALMSQLDRLHRELDAVNGWTLHARVETILSQLHLDPDSEFGDLSGGRKRQVLLARALVSEPDVLLLDEPTNHLDLDAIEWLEEFLRNSALTLVFVTHDRRFLQRLATRIVELDRGHLADWACDWDTFVARRDAMLEAEAKQWAEFDRKLAQEESWIRQGIQARRTRNEGRVRALEAMRRERRARREREGTARLQVQDAERSGRLVIEARELDYAYPDAPDRPIVRGFSTTIMRGDKIGVIGPNGSGKTTLLRLLLGELPPDHGSIRHGSGLTIAYFDQLRAQLDPDRTVEASVADGSDSVVIGGQRRHVLSYLQDFLFGPERARMPVRALSGGERNRLLLARLFTRSFNLLVMDEPTNDLDIETLDLLEALLVEFSGTLLLVSHDRMFLDNVVTSTLVMEGNGRVGEYVGGYQDWLRQRPVAAPPPPALAAPAPSRAPAPSPAPRQRKLTYAEQLELAALPEKIEALEAEQSAIHQRLNDTSLYSNPMLLTEITDRLTALESELAEAYARWEGLEGG